MFWIIIISTVTSQSSVHLAEKEKVTLKKRTTEKRDSATLAVITGQDMHNTTLVVALPFTVGRTVVA